MKGVGFLTDLRGRLANPVQLNHAAAVALYTLHYNFARQHKGLSNPYPRTRPEAAGIADHIWTCEAIAALLD